MSSDDSDRTVFQPSLGGDRTSMRPMPGGREQHRVSSNAPPLGGASPHSEAVYFQISQGLNPLVNAAASLIAVFEKTRGSMHHPDVAALHNGLTSELRVFDQNLRDSGIAPEIALAARYVLCSVLDETILNTPWGSESRWAQRTLLMVFHNEAAGGEKFFQILDRMRQSPSVNIDMLELMYICLSLGFEGKYRLSARGKEAIEQIRDDVFSLIRRHRGDYDRNLSQCWQGLGHTRNTLANYFPMWVLTAIAASLLFFSFSGFRWWLYHTSTPVAAELRHIHVVAEENNQTLKVNRSQPLGR